MTTKHVILHSKNYHDYIDYLDKVHTVICFTKLGNYKAVFRVTFKEPVTTGTPYIKAGKYYFLEFDFRPNRRDWLKFISEIFNDVYKFLKDFKDKYFSELHYNSLKLHYDADSDVDEVYENAMSAEIEDSETIDKVSPFALRAGDYPKEIYYDLNRRVLYLKMMHSKVRGGNLELLLTDVTDNELHTLADHYFSSHIIELLLGKQGMLSDDVSGISKGMVQKHEDIIKKEKGVAANTDKEDKENIPEVNLRKEKKNFKINYGFI